MAASLQGECATRPTKAPWGETPPSSGRFQWVIVKLASLRVIQQTFRRIGVHASQKAVAKTAIGTFSREIETEPLIGALTEVA